MCLCVPYNLFYKQLCQNRINQAKLFLIYYCLFFKESMEQFLNEDTKLVLFYKDRIELENNKISNLLVTDISTFKLRTQSIKSV